jgi:hypothetical protein
VSLGLSYFDTNKKSACFTHEIFAMDEKEARELFKNRENKLITGN